jgi:four helix bundle protein
MLNVKTKFDLEERTAKFGEDVLNFCKTNQMTPLNESLIKQLIRSATSIGANYMEANGSDSRRDFKNKISICKKESKETTHWLRMLSIVLPGKKDKLRLLWQEAQELVLIFSSITRKL